MGMIPIWFIFLVILPTIAAAVGVIALLAMRNTPTGGSPDWTEWNEQEKALRKRMKEWKQ